MSAPDAPIFELHVPLLTDSPGVDEAGDTLPVLGLWAAAPAAPRNALSFGLSGDTPPDGPVWRINLPADSHQAKTRLASGVQHIQAAQRALPNIEQRIAELANKQTPRQQDSVSFALAHADQLSTPEQEMMAELAYLSGRSDPQEISFGLPDIALPNREEIHQGITQVRNFLRRALHMVSNYAWVETRQNNLLLGRTAVGWTGDTETVWPQSCRAEYVDLHWKSLELSLQSRTTLVRTVMIVTQSAVKISSLLALPGGVVLALPAVWKCINRLMEEYR